MDFTREPILETIITPKEGCKLVIRSSKSAGQEEYFVDSVEIVAFGQALFFRSLERPKSFLVPVSDYEVLEVREARMVLKNVGLDRSIKIGGGREGPLKPSREPEKEEILQFEDAGEEVQEKERIQPQAAEVPGEHLPEVRVDKKRDRRRHYRKRKGREDRELEEKEGGAESSLPSLEEEVIDISPPKVAGEISQEGAPLTSNLFSSLLQPPPTLISETIRRYRQNELFKGAFYLTEEEQYKPHDKVLDLLNEDEEEVAPILEEPIFGEVAIEAEQLEEGQEPFVEQIEQSEIAQPEEEAQAPLAEEQPPLEDVQENVEGALPLYVEEERVVREEDVIEEEREQESEEQNVEPHQEQKEENDPSPQDGPEH